MQFTQVPAGKGRPLYVPLRTKFILLFCLMITVPFLMIGTITYRKYSADVERNTMEFTQDIVNQITLSLDRYVKEIERLTIAPHYDESVMAILDRHSGPNRGQVYLTTDETLKMNLFVSSLVFDRSEIEGVLIFTNDGSIFSSAEQRVTKHWEARTSEWMEAVKAQDGALTIIPRHAADYYTPAGQEVVSIARVIREPYTNRMLGIVKIDLTNRGFESLLSPVSVAGSRLRITDAGGRLVYAADEAGGEQVPSAHIEAHAESDYTGLSASVQVPLDVLKEDARSLSRFTLITSLAGLLFAYVAAVYFSSRLVKPIAHLHGKMRRVQRGMFDERAAVTTHDEIGQLTEGFNTMVGEIERLVREVYETRLREREAELSALQSQIRPHFLYNTLEIMNSLAIQGSRTELSDMVTSLGKLLRYTVDNRAQTVCLQDEIRFVESYLQIQHMRLGDRLKTMIRIDSSFEHCRVPKLILQPLVENVIEHAMAGGRVRMEIAARVEADDLIVIVRDDGIGLTTEQINRLESGWSMKQSDNQRVSGAEPELFGKVKRGYALRNVHQRIRLLHGAPYGLSLDRTVPSGTSVRIRLPFQWRD